MTRKSRSIIGAMADLDTNSVEVPPAKREVGLVASRIEAIVETGRDAGKQTLMVAPAECSIWPGNARDYDALTEESVRELIDAIIAEGGNRVPVVVRRRRDDPTTPYELLVGTRRHWAVAWANANHYPDLRLLAIVENLDDEAAFRLADVENRARTDITDLERATNYKDAITRYYTGVQRRMAERLRLSDAYLSRLLALTELPTEAIAAFPTAASVTTKTAQPLIPLVRDAAKRARIIEAAGPIAAEQARRRSAGEPVVSVQLVVSQLVGAAEPRKAKRGRGERAPALEKSGQVIARVVTDRKDLFAFQVENPAASIAEIVKSFRDELERSRLYNPKSK